LCKVIGVHPSGFYAWRLNPESKRAKEDKRLLVPIKESWLESGSVYGYRKVSDDLREPPLNLTDPENDMHAIAANVKAQSRAASTPSAVLKPVTGEILGRRDLPSHVFTASNLAKGFSRSIEKPAGQPCGFT
jgi:hypothetical protein